MGFYRRFIYIIFTALTGTSLFAQVTIYKAAAVYTADTGFSVSGALAVEGDKILETGAFSALKEKYPDAAVKSFGKKYIYPGFIDAHCHFLAYAKGLKECDLTGCKSAEDAVKRLRKFSKKNQRSWLVGRGWDQNDWADKSYPDIELLDQAFPGIPVFLKRIDGHAAWINSAAVKAIHLDVNTKVGGGQILFRDGHFSGILIDKAVDMVAASVPGMPEDIQRAAVEEAVQKCYASGLTTLDEAGLDLAEIEFLKKMQTEGHLDMRIYAMLNASEGNFAWVSEHGIDKGARMHVGAVKFYMDGALGSRGALLKQDYCDQPGYRGLQLTDPALFFSYAYFLYTHGFQVCTHAIGDSANKIVLETYGKILPPGIDMRWRVEHAQITDPKDFGLYKHGSIIPSIQPTHATSDAPWAETRLCADRMPGAYAYNTLRIVAGRVALGTDFPVEDISALKTFYAAVTRKDMDGHLKEPFMIRQSLSRKDALWGMTLWAAYANYEDREKGSLETGKYADFVVLNKDIMTVSEKALKKTRIKGTYIGGKKVY